MRQEHALGDAVVGQFVVQDQVFRAEEVAEDGGVGAMAAGKDRGRFGADEPGDLLVQLLQQRIVAAHQPARGGARPELVEGRFGGRDDRGVAGHSQVVEDRVTHHLARRWWWWSCRRAV